MFLTAAATGERDEGTDIGEVVRVIVARGEVPTATDCSATGLAELSGMGEVDTER